MAELQSRKLLSDVVAVLGGVDWYELGIHLFVPEAKLNAIKKDHNSSQRQLIAVLSYYQDNGELSWEKIIEALKKIGGHTNLIKSIKSEYITSGQQASAISAVSNSTRVESDDMHIDTVATSTGTDKELEAKRVSNLKSENLSQEPNEKGQLPGIWKLPGVELYDETSVVVHSSQGQLVEWNGLKLHIHAGSLPEGLQQCTIFIKASLAGDYEFPENTRLSLVSGIFWLHCEPQCTFIKPITVEIQHCSTQRDLSKLKIVRALCSQESLPYMFKPLKGGSFNAETFYGAIDLKGFSGVGVIEENPDSERMYYNQLFYCSCPSHQQSHAIHITFVWNTELHLNHISQKYPEDKFFAGCHRVVEIEGKEIEVALDAATWTKVMDGQWEILPAQPIVTKAALDDFRPGRGLPCCMLEARPLCEDFPQLLHEVILKGIKPPYHKVTLSYSPPKIINRDAHLPAEDGVEMTRKFLNPEGKTFDCYTAV